MIYNLVSKTIFPINTHLSKLLLFGSMCYFFLIILLYFNFSKKIPNIQIIKRNIIYFILLDLMLLIITNQQEFLHKFNIIPPTTVINNFNEYENDEHLNPFEKINENTESDINLPIYITK